MAFIRVCLDTDELTGHLGKEQLDLFDTKCVAALYRDTDGAKRARTDAEQVIAAASTTHLAIAVESTLNVFTAAGELGYICTTQVSEEESIIALKWLADTGLLVVATTKANLRVFSVGTQKFVIQLELNDVWNKCCMDEFYNRRNDAHALFVSADNGMVYRIVFDGWRSSFVRAVSASDAVVQLAALFKGAFGRKRELQMGEARFEKMTAFSYSCVGGRCVDGAFRQVEQPQKDGEMRVTMKMRDLVPPCLHARLVGNGTTLVVLTEDGTIEFINLLTMVKVTSLSIPRSSSESVIDFAFLEWPGAELEYEKIALIVQKTDRTEMQIREVDSLGTVAYAHEVVSGSFLMQLDGPSEEADRLAMVVEPADVGMGFADQSVCVRDVVETQPEQRLHRLITRGMLDEAERFAMENKLDVQVVHSARASQLLQDLTDRPDDELIFEGFLKAVEKVDRESKGDWVLGAIVPLKKAEWISRLIEYAEKEGVVDPAASSLASIAYNFATYRMVFGPNAEYGTVWREYQYSPEWTKEWIKLLTIGNVAAARIIWQRYPRDFQTEMNEGLVVDAIRVTGEMLRDYPDQWQFAIDHLETDVMSMALSGCEDTNQVYQHFIKLLVHIATALEREQPEGFPDNALYAVSAVERLVTRVKKNSLTSMRAAEFLSSSSRSVEEIESMYKRSRDLRAIKRLKETYECPLSYEKYKKLSTKEICHEILQRSVQNPAQVRDRIDRIARPFMEEHSLPVDETLLGHIEKVTSIARCQSSSEPLDVHCLLVTDAINSVAVRARAVLRIADAAPIPWSAKLTTAVQNVMGDKKIEQKIKESLSLASSRMRLGAICQNFGLDREYVDSAIDTYADFTNFIRFLFTGSLTSTRELTDEGRFDIAAEAVSIYDRLRPGVRPPLEAPRVDVREYILMLIGKGDLGNLHKFVQKHEVIDETIEMLVMREETEDYAFEGDKDWQSHRTSSIVAINSLIQRHRREDSRWKETYEEMRKMHTLVTVYSMDVSLHVLRSSGMKASLLHRYMKREERKLRECLELSTALGLSHDDAFLALLDYSAPMCPRKQKKREDEVDVSSALYLCKKALQHAQTATTALLQHVVHVAELVMKRILASSSHSPMSIDACVKASDDVEDLDEIIPRVLELDVDLMVTDRALSIHRAVRLIRETVRQMQQGQQTRDGGEEGLTACSSRRNSLDEGEEMEMRDVSASSDDRKKNSGAVAGKDAALTNGPPLALSNRRRVGVYDASMDNPILGTADTMRVVCGVSFMVEKRPDPTEKGGAKRLEEMEERWSELFSELNLASQYMLEMHARVLYAVWGGRAEGSSVLRPLVEGALVERLVQQHPCDLPLLATILATLDESVCMETLARLVRFAAKEGRKSPQTMLNVCRIAQLMLYRKDRSLLQHLQPSGAAASTSDAAAPLQTPAQRTLAAPETAKWKTLIKDRYTRAMWEKTLGKRKIIAHTDAQKAVHEFASHLLPPETVSEYLYGLPLNKLPWDHMASRPLTADKQAGLIASGMTSYLIALLANAVRAKEDFERAGFLITADSTIELVLSKSVYSIDALRSFLSNALENYLEKECCPYAHEVVQFVLGKLIALGDPNDERWKNGKKVADFICEVPRAFSISAEERAWYTERINAKNMESGSMGESMLADEMNFAQLPEEAGTRLPYHLLLSTSEVDVAKYVVPIAWHEITLKDLTEWYNLLRDVQSLKTVRDMKSEKLKLKRPMLITKAVMKYIKTAQEQNDQLSDTDMDWIQERLYAEKSVSSLLYTFALETMQVAPQGNTRIQLMQLGYNVTKKFLEEQPENAPDRDKIEMQQKRLRESLREMNTKRLLQNHKIFNQDTSPYVKDVEKLISRIYDRFINWDEPTDVEQKCALIKELAKTNEHDLEETHAAIVGSWLCGENGSGEGEEGLPDVDMNDTMGSIPGDFGAGADRSTRDDEDYLPIPFYDEEVTRIVHVVRLSRDKQRLVQSLLLNYVNMSSPPGGHSTHIRAVSTLLRACTAEELAAWAPASIDDYAGNLDKRLTRRLVERSLGAAAYAQFEKTIDALEEQPEKLQQFIRSLLLGTQRTRPGTIWLASVLTMDYYNENDRTPIVDQKLIDHMLSKLNADRKYALLAAFLKFCNSSTAFRNTRNLNVLWGRTIESAMKELEDESTPLSTVQEWLLFALSCPCPGNQALESLKRLMEKRGATIGAYLVKLASSYTKSPPAPSPSAWLHLKPVDYPVQWAVKREEMENEKSMDATTY